MRICDKCKDITKKADFLGIIYIAGENFNGDICEECLKEMKKLLKQYLPNVESNRKL